MDIQNVNYSKNFLRDQKEIFNYYMNTELFPVPRNGENFRLMKDGIEFIIRPECNQQCEYCYIYQHGKELYPEKRTREEILHNFKLFLDYIFFKRRNFSRDIELFAGDLFFDDIFFDIMDIFDSFFKQIKEQSDILDTGTTIIIIPSNLSWVYDNPEKVEKVEKILEYFRENYRTRVMFSWSTDGLLATDTREKKELNEDYFNSIMDFCMRNCCGVHPMVSAENIENWIDGNYDWWIDFWNKYPHSREDFLPPMLEVRNNDWTEEKIEKLLEFYRLVFQRRFEMCHSDIDEFAHHLIVGNGDNNYLPALNNYDHLSLSHFEFDGEKVERTSCSMQNLLHLNCTNLSIAICHRLSYNLFVPAFFKTNEDNTEIVDYDVNNIDTYIAARSIKDLFLPGCVNCEWKNICLKGCLGSQYESSGDLFLKNKTVCDMFKAKYSFLLKLYNEYGVIKKSLEKGYFKDERYKNFFIKNSERLGYTYE